MDKLSIIIVNWNTGELLARCLSSIAKLPEVSEILKVVIVDNASSDSSVKAAKKAVDGNPLFEFVELDENVGFAAGNAKGMEKLGNEHVLLLNPDTVVQPGAIKAFLEALELHPQAGVVGCRLLNPDKATQPSVRAFPTLPIFLIWFLKLRWLVSETSLWRSYIKADFDYLNLQRVDQVMGAAFLIRDTVRAKLGGLDESYWIWFEEVDYCKQVKRAGWDVVYTPAGEIVHYGGASFNQLIGLPRVMPFIRSSLTYTRKHLGVISYLVLLVLSPVALLLAFPASLVHIIRRRKQHARMAHI